MFWGILIFVDMLIKLFIISLAYMLYINDYQIIISKIE